VGGECVGESASSATSDAFEPQRLREMSNFRTMVSGLFDETLPTHTGALKDVARLMG
jgi:hypothetical protein